MKVACLRTVGTFADHRKTLTSTQLQVAIFLLQCAILAFSGSALAQQGMFIPSGNMSTARVSHTATLLNNGKVLVAGGYSSSNNNAPLVTAELYDPPTGTFSATGNLTLGRYGHTATLLNNGKVLVAGGSDGTSFVASAELYDPARGSFVATGSMTTARYFHTATLLNSGLVLIVGGEASGITTTSAELYDPATGSFTATGSLSTARSSFSATLLTNGKVLIAGGTDPPLYDFVYGTAELYDPLSGTFTLTGNMIVPHASHSATLLNSGEVLIAGGLGQRCGISCWNAVSSAELYDPSTGSFALTGSMTAARAGHSATLLNNGTVVVAEGDYLTAEVYDPTTTAFTATGNMTTLLRNSSSGILLNTGAVFFTGGQGQSAFLASSEPTPLHSDDEDREFGVLVDHPLAGFSDYFLPGSAAPAYPTGTASLP